MKKVFNLFCLASLLLVISCGKDKCADVDCGNGTCDDGTCICIDGYEGTACDIISSQKYFGTYTTGASDCGAGNTTSIDEIIIFAHPNGNPTEINITLDSGAIIGTLDGTINDMAFSAAGDWGGFDLDINGTFTDDNTLDVILMGGGFTCDITFEK